MITWEIDYDTVYQSSLSKLLSLKPKKCKIRKSGGDDHFEDQGRNIEEKLKAFYRFQNPCEEFEKHT